MDHVKQAADERRKAQRQLEAINADRDLNPEARKRRAAEVTTAANRRLTELREAYTQARTAEQERARRRLFGLSFTASASEAEKQAARLSYRDALFRVEGVTAEDVAAKLMGRASMVGDKLLMRALALVAYEQNWHTLVDQYAAEVTDAAADFETLRAGVRASVDRRLQLDTSMAFAPVSEGAYRVAI
jgi:hypothetical protein